MLLFAPLLQAAAPTEKKQSVLAKKPSSGQAVEVKGKAESKGQPAAGEQKKEKEKARKQKQQQLEPPPSELLLATRLPFVVAVRQTIALVPLFCG